MDCFYTFCILPLVSICFVGFSYAIEKTLFSVHSVNVSRTETALEDRFYLRALNVSSCNILQNVAGEAVKGKCDLVSYAFEMCLFQCGCLGNTSSFVINEKKCIDERVLREGK